MESIVDLFCDLFFGGSAIVELFYFEGDGSIQARRCVSTKCTIFGDFTRGIFLFDVVQRQSSTAMVVDFFCGDDDFGL